VTGTERLAQLQADADDGRHLDLARTERFAPDLDDSELAETRRRVLALVNRCQRHGLAAPQLHAARNEDGTWAVLLTGLEVKVPGDWMMVAVIDHHDGLTTVLPGAPEGTFDRWQGAPNHCEECERKSFRTKTVVVRDSSGTEKQLGGQCATTFLGMSTEVAFTFARDVADEDDYFMGSDVEARWFPDTIVRAAVLVVQAFGFVSRQAVAEAEYEGRHLRSTAETVRLYLQDDRRVRREVEVSTPVGFDSFARAKQVMDFARQMDGSDYAKQVAYLANLDRPVRAKRVGLLASAVSAFDREQAKQASAKARLVHEGGQVPVVDKRVQVEGVVLSFRWVDNAYGSTLKMLVGCDGYKLWGTVPRDLVETVEAGDRVRFVARLERSTDNDDFGFYSRPGNAEVVSAEEAA
jgi:hypothetical protein